MPEVNQLELNAKNNAEQWKVYEETEDFKQVYVRKSAEQRDELSRKIENLDEIDDEDDQCTLEPPKIWCC